MSPSPASPPRCLMAVLVLCLIVVFAGLWLLFPSGGPSAEAAAAPTPSASAVPTATPEPAPTPTPTPEPTPTPTPEPDWSQPVPESEAADQEEWFSDAVFIGDSRTDGFRLYSGVTAKADFLDHNGITVYDVVNGKSVIRQGDKKVSILEALGQKEYGKVYISLGANELGYSAPENFAETYAALVDAVLECQQDALIYVQAIIPVNTDKCKSNNQPYYVTNEAISAYNAALAAMAQEKKVRFIAVPDALVDEEGEVPRDLSADGVHFKKDGYTIWLDYLITHTGF